MAVTLAELFPTLRSIKTGSVQSATVTHGERNPWKRRSAAGRRVASPRASVIAFETIEPRVLLSADFTSEAAVGLAGGIDQFDVRIDNFLLGDDLFDTRVPMLLEVKMDESGGLVNEAPTIGELFSVPRDANLDGALDVGHGTLFDTWDDDEWALWELDTYKGGQIGAGNNDGYVSAPEFLEKWLWDPISNYLRSVGDGWSTQDFVDFLTGDGTHDGLDQELYYLFEKDPLGFTVDPLYEIEFHIVGASDTTQDPDAEYTFLIDFELVITRNYVPLDLGLQADALRLLYFTGEFDDSADPVKVPTVRTTSTLSFGFEFGIHTGGEAVVDQNDFFVRRADPLVLSVEAEDSDVDFHLNVGFLGAEVENGTFSLQADVESLLLDPDDPAVLGFTNAQRGVEQTSGVVTAANPLPAEPAAGLEPASPNYDLAHATSFFLRVGNIGINTPVSVPDDGNNASLDNLREDLEGRLDAAGLGDIITVSFVGSGDDTRLQLSLVSTTNTPLGFANETYGVEHSMPAGFISALPEFLEYADDQRFLLSLGGAIPRLVTVVFPDPAREDIKLADATDAILVDGIRAPNAPTVYDVTADAVFTVVVTRANGARDTVGFTLTPTNTDENTTALELAADLDAKLNGTALDTLVQFYLDGSGHVRLHAIDGAVTGIQLTASGTATSEVGFAAYDQVTLELSATAPAVANLGDAAHFRLYYTGTSFGGTVDVTVPDNNRTDVAALANDINAAVDAAVGSNLFDVEVTATGRIVLVATTTDVVAFRVVTVNESIDDLVVDVNRALDRAGYGGLVSASSASTTEGPRLLLQSVGAAAGKTLEISHTLTFDAGVTYAELATADIDELFGAAEGTDSHVEFNFPVRVLPGLDNGATAAEDNWNPQFVAMVGNFSPFARGADSDGYDPAVYNKLEHRFQLNFFIDPDTAVPAQDTPNDSAPAITDLAEKIVLNNFAELLNFNLVTAEGMAGLIASLGSSLQQLANSATFAGFDIPFTGAQLSDLLNLVDPDKKLYSGLIDTFLIDTSGNGIEGVGEGAAPDYDGLVKRVVLDGKTLLVPAFTTAQALAWRLHEVLEVPLSSINATYDPRDNKLTYDIDRVSGNRSVVSDAQQPFEFDVEMDPFLKLTLDASADPTRQQVTLSGRPGLQMTMGIDLSPPGPVIYPTTPLSDLYSGTGVSVIQGVEAQVRYGITGTVDLYVAGPNDPPDYQLGGDARLDISVEGTPSLQELVIKRAATFNRSMADLVADVNNALAGTVFSEDAGGTNRVYLSEYLEAAYDGRRLVLLAREAGVQFAVTDTNGTFGYLGIHAVPAVQADFVITIRDDTYLISLASLTAASTVQAVIDLIELQTSGAVDVQFNATQSGLRLVAADTTVGKGEFRVDTLNASTALLQLGFLRAGDEGYYVQQRPQLGQEPYIIDGGSLGFTQINQRFFIRNAEMRIDGLTVVTPSYGDANVEAANRGILGDALYGIVGVDTRLEGKIEANVRAALVDPNPYTTVEGETRELLLSELQAQTGVLQSPVVTTSQRITATAPGIGAYENFIGWRLTGAPGAYAVLVAVEPTPEGNFVLHLADVHGTFNPGEPIGRVDRNNVAILLGAVAAGLSAQPDFGTFQLNVTVQPGFDDVAFADGFELVKGKAYTLPMALTHFGNPATDTLPATSIDTSSLGELKAFQNLTYAHLQTALHQLLQVLEDVEEKFTLLDTPLPAIGRSISDLLALVDGFERGVANADTVLNVATKALEPGALDLPALRLQDLPRALRSAFGMPVDAPIDTAEADWVKFRFQDDMLLVDLSLVDTISTKLGLDIVTGDGLPNLTSGGVLKTSGTLDMRLNIGIDLANPTAAYLYDSSRIRAAVKVEGEGQQYTGGLAGLGLVFRAALGPLAVFVKDGDASIDVQVELPMKDMGVAGRKLLGSVEWTDWDASNAVKKDTVAVVLPMFYGGEGPDDFIGEYRAIGSLANVDVKQPCYADIKAGIEGDVVEFEPFDNIMLAIDALDVYLQTLTDRIATDVLGINLPFVGRQLTDALFIEEFRANLIRTLKEGIANAVNPDPDTIVQELLQDALTGFLVGGVGYTGYAPETPNTQRKREWSFTIGDKVNDNTLVLDDFDLGIPNLGFDVDTPVQVTLDWTMKITFGVNYGEGAYIKVNDGEEIDLKLKIELPFLPDEGTLGYLPVDVSNSDTINTGAFIDFDVDVRNGNSTSPNAATLLGSADLGSIVTVAEIMGGDKDGSGGDIATLRLVTEASPGLPSLRTDLDINWSLAPDTLVDSLNGDAVAPGVTRIAYNDVHLDAGTVAGTLLGEVFGTVAEYIEPFMPVVDTISAPIPILSDVAGEDFTLIDLAKLLSGSDAVDDRFIDAVADILDVISAISSFGNAPELPLGSMVLYDGPGGNADLFNPRDPESYPGTDPLSKDPIDITIDGYDGETNTTPGITHDSEAFKLAIESSPDFLVKVRDGELAENLTIPVLTDPTNGLRMLLGQSAVLIDYALPPLKVGFDFYQLFPIYGPLGVSIEIGFSFGVDLHSVGFDTNGYMRYGDFGFRNEALILDGFYFNDLDESKVDAPEVVFEFSLVGAAELNLGIARAGVGGGIDARITFDWHDPIVDGRVHISEILGSIESADDNPLAVFDPGGELTFQLFAFLEISLIGFRLDIPITPETKLFSFEVDLARDPLLATQNGSTLYLNMGPNAEDRLHGDTSDGSEYFSIKHDGDKVWVWSDRLGVEEGDAQDFSGVSHIVGLGGQGDDVIELHGFDGKDVTALLDGGVGDDRIEYVGSAGSADRAGALLIGGIGNDTLTGGDANDRLYGGEGNDTLKGGGGYDILFGDQGRVADSVTPKFISSFVDESDGDDSLAGGDADDILIGGGGNDTLAGDAGNDLLIGDGGRFEYTTTGNHVDLSGLRPFEYERPLVDTDAPKDPEAISSEIEALADHVAARITATDLGVGGNDVLLGGTENDLMIGGSGDDRMFGNAGADFMIAGKGFDSLYGGGDNDTMFGGDQADTMYGGSEDDVMAGGGGNDLMHGDGGKDVMKGDAGADVMFGDAGDDQVFGLVDPDVLFGGADNDLVVGGTGNDIIFGDDGLVAKLDPAKTDGSGDSKIIGIGAVGLLTGAYRDGDLRTVDLIITDVRATDGDDILSGEAGDDQMLGGGGNDRFGGDLDPRLPTAPLPPLTTPPTPGTPIGEDVMIGDGGQLVFDKRRFRLIEALASQSAGTKFDDTMYGDNGNDYIFGGRGSDYIFGGHGRIVDVVAGTIGAFRGSTDTIADDNDIIVGDNGQMHFAGSDGTNNCPPTDVNFGRLTRVNTSDTAEDSGGHEYVEGEYGDDVIFGGVNGTADPMVDRLYGDTVNPTAFDTLHAGQDIVIGDNGEIDFDFNDTAHDLDTLDLIRSYRDARGGTDQVSGNAGDDVLIGGTAGDTMYGDDDTASAGPADGEDVMLGDNGAVFLIGTDGRLLVRVADMPRGTAVDRITTTDDLDSGDVNFDEPDEVEKVGGPDTMSGNAGNDIMLGGVNGLAADAKDKLYGDRETPDATTIGDDGDDILLGDNGELRFTLPGGAKYAFRTDTDRDTLDLIRSYEDGLGGQDELSGNKGLDVAIGSTGDDLIFGDDAGYTATDADLADILLGDNADLFLVDAGGAQGGDLKVVLGSAVDYLLTTDKENPQYGGIDRISGNAGGDIIAGGVFGDYLWGDREIPEEGSWVNDGNDIMLGDNALLEWLSNGRFADSAGLATFIAANNVDLAAKFTGLLGLPKKDADLTTLDLITTAQPTKGGRDRMWGDEGSDLMFGGTDTDVMYGDDGNEVYQDLAKSNQDVMFGDHGRLYPQFSRYRAADGTLVATNVIHSRNFFAIDMGLADGGQGDVMRGEEGDDVMLGQQGDDRMWGGLDDDDMIGGHNRPDGYDELEPAGAIAVQLKSPDNYMNDVMDGGFGDDAMAGDNAVIWRRGDDLSPRFRALTAETIYSPTDKAIVANVGDGALDTWQSDPADAVGRDIELLDHSDAVQASPQGRFGQDVMAGGADDDVMFGQLGDDLMQGDGAIQDDEAAPGFISRLLAVTDTGSDPDTDETLYFVIPEQETDGDDYMEGNGGRDLMYGGLGQDDMIGGSSELFGLTTEQERPDDSDTMFGGAGVALGRNDIGATSFDLASEDTETHVITTAATGHARDADYMMGDNANVLRLVTGVTEVGAEGYDEFLTFNYDNYDAVLKIIPRAMQQLDYTLGGGDYYDGGYNADGQATVAGRPVDNGKADLIHGESGDDVIFGMTGSDVLFGEGQDDDIVGGYGHDWISGGTGQDGIIGDDGIVYTSRNSATYGESLYGIDALLARDPEPKYSNGNVLDELIATPGSIQTALINREDELKKSVDLVPFSYDSGWMGIDDEYPDNMDDSPFADDIIFGGLGSDWLHGGSGDDAISGAEALEHALVPQDFYVDDGELKPHATLDLGYSMVGIANALIDNPPHSNPGDVLAFNKEDTDGQHLNNRFRAGEFYLYDEYDPRREILLTGTGDLSKEPTGSQYLLNFAEEEGVVRPAGTLPKATGQQTAEYPQVNDDGADVIFGDLGNDWLVGGTGRDNVYGGWGNDLMNVDDTHATHDGLNDQPDTHPYFEDRAYGGAGRDVLIGNTGGDRLIDWVGEYNSYLVPYAPFGQASVSRTLQPFLPEFLYALSKGDGADQSQASYDGDPRNGEPAGELGLVLQKDQAWQDQTGAPADPQAGNIPGGKRDVLRSADFGDGTAQGFVPESGTWTVKSGRYEVSPLASSGTTDAISLFNADVVLPSYFEIAATINAVKPIAGFKANAYVLFDYVSPTDFKFAGINVSTKKFEIGQRTAAGWQVLTSLNVLVKQDIDYNLLVAVNGNTVTAVLNGKLTLSYAYQPRQDADGFTYLIRDGMVGLGGDNARARIDNVRVQVIPPAITYSVNDAFDGTMPWLLAPDAGTWLVQDGRYAGTPAAGAPFALAGNDIRVGLNAMLRLDTVVRTAATGGVVFDMYSPTDFKWAAVSVSTQQVLIGHYTAKGGWVVDAAVSRSLMAGTDYALTVALKGSTVSVLLNGQAALSRVYNSNVVDGAVGTFARGGSASFDSFGLATDDTRFAAAVTTSASTSATASATTKTAPVSTSKLALGRARSAGSLEDGWRIDWRAAAKKAATPAKGHVADWQEGFALRLGKAERPNPNAGLRLWL